MRKYLAALVAVTAIIRAQPANSGCALNRGLQLHQAGDWDGAIREYRACLAAEPGRVEVRSNLGAVYAKLGRYQEAIGEYRQALASAPPETAPRLRYNLALAYYKSFQIPQAAAELTSLRELAPADLNVALLLADCHLRLGEFKAAADLLQPFEGSHPDDHAVAYVLGMALIRDGRIQAGQQRVDRILKQGDSAEGHLLLGSAFLAARDYPAAVKELRLAASINPAVPSLQSLYGQALLATGDPDAALTAFQRELTVNPNDYDANFQLASILAFRGQQGESQKLLQRALLVRPDSAEAQQARAKGFQFSKQADDGLPAGAVAPRIGTIDWRRPTVLVFGSYTCPKLRSSAAALNRLFDEFGEKVDFQLVYIREAHAAQGQWQSTINEREGISLQPARTLTEKTSSADLCVRKLHIRYSKVVDAMDDTAEKAYAAWPSRVYLVGRDGRVIFNSRLGELDFQPERLAEALRKTLANEASRGTAR